MGADGSGAAASGGRAGARARARSGPAAGDAAAGRRLVAVPGGGGRPGPRPERLVVFLGVGDDARSRVAATLLAHRSKGRVLAVSASRASVDPDPAMAAALAELGADLAACPTRAPTPELLEAAELVVVMGYDQRRPADDRRTEDWWIDDPRGKHPDAVRCIRDALDRRVQRLLIRMGVAVPTRPR
jgi:protein-tyrosine-phosphatase